MYQAQMLWDRVPLADRWVFAGRTVIHWLAIFMHLLAGPTMYWGGVLASVTAGAIAIGALIFRGMKLYGWRAAIIGSMVLATCPTYARWVVQVESEPF